jgi:NAD(P)-dependent dehydrogenase (short-subunit alcohol dehydrogenase family)
MESKTVLITGITGAIGKATAIELAKKNCLVILLGRNAAKVAAVKSEIVKITGNSNIDSVIADLSEQESIRRAVSELKKKYSSLNALVNVAGIFRKDRTENSNGLEYMFATNHLGPFVLTTELLDLLKSGKGRVVTVSAPSTTKINFEDLHGRNKFSSGFMGSFGASKMMNIMFTYALARRSNSTGVPASVFHPGLVKSELTREMPAVLYFIFKAISGKPDNPAKMLCRIAIDKDFENANGVFYNFKGKEIKSSKYSTDKDIQEKLWTISEELAK